MKLRASHLFPLRHTLIVAGSVALIAWAITEWSLKDDPAVGDRRLSVSVMDMLNSRSPTYMASSNVVAQLGIRAIPFLRAEINRPTSAFELMANKFGLPLPAHRTVFGRQLVACRAAKILGTNALSLKEDLLPLVQSRIGSVRQAALEALFGASEFTNIYAVVTNAIMTDRFIECRLAAARYALAQGADPETILSLAVESIGNGTSFKGETVRRFAEELKTFAVPEKVLEKVCLRFSVSEEPEVRRLVASALPICLPSSPQTVEILHRLMADTNGAVSWAATNAASALSRLRQPQ